MIQAFEVPKELWLKIFWLNQRPDITDSADFETCGIHPLVPSRHMRAKFFQCASNAVPFR